MSPGLLHGWITRRVCRRTPFQFPSHSPAFTAVHHLLSALASDCADVHKACTNMTPRNWKACWGRPLTSSNLVSSATPRSQETAGQRVVSGSTGMSKEEGRSHPRSAFFSFPGFQQRVPGASIHGLARAVGSTSGRAAPPPTSRSGGRVRRQDRERPDGGLPPPLRGPRQRASCQPGAIHASLEPLQLITSSARRSDVRGKDGARGSAGSGSRGDR